MPLLTIALCTVGNNDRLRVGGMVKGLLQLSRCEGLIMLERHLLQCGR